MSACSIFRTQEDARSGYARDLSEDRRDELSNHLKSMGEDYLKIIGDKAVVKLTGASKQYLKEMHHRILTNNELVFPHNNDPNFYIISERTPFHFSLPGGNYFFSSALIRKYLTNEDLLAAVMAIEMLRSEKKVYEKRAIVPIGNIGTDKMLGVVRVPIEVRSEINKWAYLLMRRAGYDAGALLNLIQLKNRNALDFSASVGNISTISREEFNYKNFLSRTPSENKESVVEKNSARGFYALRANVVSESE